MKKFILGYFILIGLIVLSFFGYKEYQIYNSKKNLYKDDNNIVYASRINNKKHQIHIDGEWKDITIKGVNLGAAEPGSFPGDMSIEKETYLRWFKYISEMNANTIRVYTLQNTDFYEALFEFNLNNNNPLYLIHGVWINEEHILTYGNAFENIIYDGYIEEAFNIIDAIHGDALIEPKVGHASGEYTKDISQYVIGWILGIEFEAPFVNKTNEMNPEKTSFQGNYLYTEKASPFEVFLAETGDKIISYEVENYGMQRPTAFSNWLTTDPLDHPNEPHPEMEDSAIVDVEHIKWNDNFIPGMFASYHIYPYYPDFLNYDTKYISESGDINTYKAYLEELSKYHSLPILVAEFGLPASRGIAHKSKYSGYNQGYLTEEQQGEYISSMIDDILDEDLLGFLVFSWQDEWFKRSWNTMSLENPSGRPYWMNVQTGEKNFGLLAFDPGPEDTILYVDGSYDEWTEDDIILNTNDYSLSVKEDSSYLYLLVDTRDFDFGKDKIFIPIDTIRNQGNRRYLNYSFEKAADFIIRIDGIDNTEVLVDPYYDVFYYEYSVLAGLYNKRENYNIKNSNNFSSILLALNRPYLLPETNEYIEFEVENTGKLKYGIANPNSKEYNSLSDFYYNDGKIELRIPWNLLNFSNPATCEILDNLYNQDEEITFTSIDSIFFGIVAEEIENVNFGKYSLEGWVELNYHERLKQSYHILKQKFSTIE